MKMALFVKTILERFKGEWRGFSRKPPFVEMSRRYGRSVMEYMLLHTLILYYISIMCIYIYVHAYMHICGNWTINDRTNQRRETLSASLLILSEPFWYYNRTYFERYLRKLWPLCTLSCCLTVICANVIVFKNGKNRILMIIKYYS